MNKKKILVGLFVVSMGCTSTIKPTDKDSIKVFEKLDSIQINVNRENKINNQEKIKGNIDFLYSNYYKITNIYTGEVFTNKEKEDVFYRIIEISEEENISLYLEVIFIGEEGGLFKLAKRIRLTNDNEVLPKFGLGRIDSLRFVDSVNIEGVFNDKKIKIDLSKVK